MNGRKQGCGKGGMKRGGMTGGECPVSLGPAPILSGGHSRQSAQRTPLSEGRSNGFRERGAGSQSSLPHSKDIPRTAPPSQRAKGSTAKESYLLSAPLIPVCLL